jgi:hypothetical protein
MRRLVIAANPGGRHEPMGTPNALLRLGEAIYLEVIAIGTEAAIGGYLERDV